MIKVDHRSTFIFTTAGHFFGVPLHEETISDQEIAILHKFLDQATCRTLYATPASHDDNPNRLELSQDNTNGKNTLVFFKLQASPVTEENFHDLVQITSIGGGVSVALVEALRQVWEPALRSSGLNFSKIFQKLEEDLLGPRPPISVLEEEEYWKKKSEDAKRSRERSAYSEANKILKSCRVELENAAISRDGISGMEEVPEVISGLIDDLWKLEGLSYSEERMRFLMDVIGNDIVAIMEQLLDGIHSSGQERSMEEAITMGATVSGKWTNACQKLTTLFWPNQSVHPWRGEVVVPEKCATFGRRLGQVSESYAQHRQLIQLLTPSERIGLRMNELLPTFDDIKSDERNDMEWDRTRRRIEESLVPAEERVSQKLKHQIADAKTPNSLMGEFWRYRELLKRNNLQQALRSERESLLSAYEDLIENCSHGRDTGDVFDIPKVLREIQKAKASELRLENLKTLGKELLSDLPNYEQVSSKVVVALKEVQSERQRAIECWVESTRNAVTKKELSLGTNSAVIELIGNRMMRVTYDPRLSTLIKEARALSGLGVELPREVKDLVERAGSLAGRARALQQIATFHNTIGDRMVLSQRPLMLTMALELSRAVKEQSGVVWSDPQAVDAYTARLQDLVRKFARQNSELAAKHATLRNLVLNLLKGETANLIGHQGIWKETLANMRSIVDGVEAEYGNTKAWKLHWDRQLLKALGAAYRNTLPTLLKKLPEVRVELTFRDGSLQWRPSLEEIRAKLYSSVRRALSIPMNFRGVGDQADAQFGDLIQRNAFLFGGVYKEAEIVLSSMESVREKWLYLAAPAKIDAGEKLKGQSPQEWTKALKDAKQWAQEVGKLRGGEVKIWCITVETSTTRNDLESATRRYWERLCSDLRAEASSRLIAVADFLSSSLKELQRRPRNVEEVGQACEAHSRITQRSDGIAQEMEEVVGLAKVLSAWTSEHLEGVNSTHTAWQDLTDRLENYKTLINRQVEDAKVNLRHRGMALRDERERWEVRWSSKSTDDGITMEWIESMRLKLFELIQERDALVNDCGRIGLKFDEISVEDGDSLSKLELELEAEESNCRFQGEFLDELKRQESEEWSVARRRLPRLHDWLDSWEAKIKIYSEQSSEGEKEKNSSLEIETFVGKKLREIRNAMEWIQILRGDELAEEHWMELRSILGLIDVRDSRDITLGHLLAATNKYKENADRVKDIAKKAAAESGIRQALIDLEAWENSTSLRLQDATDSKNNPIVLVLEYGSLLARSGELRLLLEGAKGAVGYERFSSRAARCETGLFELEDRIKILNTLQRKWVYLEPIYGGGAAPKDSGRWTRADKEFRYLISEVSRDPRVSSLRGLPIPAMTNLKDLFDRCQKNLDEFLEEKRSSYPRLYFLSDEDLLELVSGSSKGLETHLPKLYQGVGLVIRRGRSLLGVTSPEGETLNFLEPVNLEDVSLPQWLNNLEEEMRKTLRHNLDQCLIDSRADPSEYPTQILLLSGRIRFTERCEEAFKDNNESTALKNLVEFLETQRAKYRKLEDAGDQLTAMKARGLLLDTVHHLQIARELLSVVTNDNKIEKSLSWTWQRQLRIYRTNNGPVIKCVDAEFPYRFEYQGAAEGLVYTPLTERCFLALTQAMKLGLGGSPTGPAGTGKTESVKALGSLMGRRVLVFNCDEGMDASSMKRILGGLVQSGAWGCFDEFNRLEEETLSAVAMLVRPIQEGIRDGAEEVLLGDQKIHLDKHCCIFITMNPAGIDYGGRHKLPDSLARLFRPIGMAHPDKFDIAEALLQCASFLEASNLADRLVETLDISETLLSGQPHYDWGLRALRSILDSIPSIPGANEAERLLLAIKSSTVPKLTEEDTPKFLALLEDVFPKISMTSSMTNKTQDLLKILQDICDTRGFGVDIIDRCIQLNDQLKNRTGVAIVGPPGSGKSTIRKLLAEALTKIGDHVNQILIYPGAMPKTRLFGRVDPITRELKEGLLTNTISAAGESSTWIVLDGDVEPEWAEALNSTLDDNKLLTLPNGVGIKLGNNTRFIFETHKLAGSSPATVSRLGVIHMSSTNPDLILKSRLKMDQFPNYARNIVETHLSNCIREAFKIDSDLLSVCTLIDTTLIHINQARSDNEVIFGFLTTLCGQMKDESSQNHIARFIYQATDCWCPDPQNPYAVIYNQETDRLEPFEEPSLYAKPEDDSTLLLGPIKRALTSILPWVEENHSILIRGSEACGKSSLINMALSKMKIKAGELSTVIQGSSLYGPQDLINRIRRACIKLESSSNGRIYKPRNGTRLILILEDIHLASKELQELTRELVQEGSFHEEDLEFAKLHITMILTADVTTKLHPRLESLLATHILPYPNSKEMLAMLEFHLKRSLNIQNGSTEALITRVAPAMLEAFESKTISLQFASHRTPRDIFLWASSLKWYPFHENESDIINYLLNSAQQLFQSRLSEKNLDTWETILTSKIPKSKTYGTDVFIGKSDIFGLTTMSEEQWKIEITHAGTKCAREGEPILGPISEHLLRTVASLCWSFGTDFRGIVLTGRPGSGRKSAIRLAAAFSNKRLIESGAGRGKSSMKTAVQAAGIDGEPTLLLLEEHHMREPGISILASAMISRGEIPGLLSLEEIDGLVAPLADLARGEDFSGTLELYLFHRIRNNLRVLIILDIMDIDKPWLMSSSLLRHSIVIGPSTGNEWWSKEKSLTNLALQIMTENPQEPSSAMKMIVQNHLRVTACQRAPARFFALLQTWKLLRDTWSCNIDKKILELEAGIGKLREAGEQVATLEDQASNQRKELEIEKGRAAAALEQITATMRGATGQRGEMTNLKAETEKESTELARRKIEIEHELGKVKPLVDQASQAVAGISADALAEVRSLRAPPAPVRDVLEGVLRLMGIKDTSWNSMKTFLAKRGIKDEIRTWDPRRSTAVSLDAVGKLVKERSESFEEKTAKRASVAAAPLAAWVLANLQYGQIIQQVAPLEREQRVLAGRLSAAEAQLNQLATGLSSVESRVTQLQEELAEHSRGAAALQLRSEGTEASLRRARDLLQKLDTEHKDWETQLEELTNRKKRLDIEAVQVASLLVYQDQVEDDKYKKNAIDLLISEREQLLWRAQGLPADTESLVGAACILRGPLVPILLDPSGIAVTWLKSNVGRGLEITRAENSNFPTTLELAVRFGKPILIEELITFPSILLPLLRGRPLKLGDRILRPQKGFQMFLATRRDKLEQVGVPREADAVMFKVTLSTGTKSLAERFIEKILLKETPDIETERKEALEREEKLSGERDAARADLLTQLGAARGQDLLQETQGSQGGVLTSLEATQSKAKEIAIALEESHRSLESVSRRAKSHESLAQFTANLYNCLEASTALSSLYVFSVEAFTDIYLEAESHRHSLVESQNKEDIERIIENRIVTLTFRYCSKAVYRKHRLPLALHMALFLHPVPEVEKNILIYETSSLPANEISRSDIPNWIPEERRSSVEALISTMPQLSSKMKSNWLENIGNISGEKSLTKFQRLLMIKVLRPDYLHSSLTNYAAECLDVKDLAPIPCSLQKIAKEETKRPVLLLLSPGADPSLELKVLATDRAQSNATEFVEISLGQGQVAQAELALETACRNGSWILLSNLQLALNWLPRLESLLRSPICTTERKDSTRIWLTTEECQGFYQGLAGICLKLAYEPPEGVKKNVKRSFQQLQQKNRGNKENGGMLLLAWLHATLQERRKFVPQSWIRAYEWNESDLEAAYELVVKEMIKRILTRQDINWEAGQGLLDAAIYGGRLQNENDLAALCSIIRDIWDKDILEGRGKLGGALNVTGLEDPIKAVERLNENDSPKDYFGLPANAHRAWERSAAESVLNYLKGTVKGNLRVNEEQIERPKLRADLKQLIERHKTIFSKSSVSVEMENNGKEKPIDRFISDEIGLVKKLLKLVTTDIEAGKLTTFQTPKNWLAMWSIGPKEPIPFVKGLLTKYKLLESLESNRECIDFSALMRPSGFLAALKQQTARETGYPLENLRLRTNWLDEGCKKIDWKCFVIIDGLLISGASIKDGTLKDLDGEAAPVLAVPRCQVAFVPGERSERRKNKRSMIDDEDEDEYCLDIPIYANPNRDVFIFSLPVKYLKEEKDIWLRRGSAFHLKRI